MLGVPKELIEYCLKFDPKTTPRQEGDDQEEASKTTHDWFH
jgi:hypothetical protein